MGLALPPQGMKHHVSFQITLLQSIHSNFVIDCHRLFVQFSNTRGIIWHVSIVMTLCAELFLHQVGDGQGSSFTPFPFLFISVALQKLHVMEDLHSSCVVLLIIKNICVFPFVRGLEAQNVFVTIFFKNTFISLLFYIYRLKHFETGHTEKQAVKCYSVNLDLSALYSKMHYSSCSIIFCKDVC